MLYGLREVEKLTENDRAEKFTEMELEYYSRQMVMAELGYNAQLKLKNSRACLVGVGGLGSPAAVQLVAMGVGYLRIVDRDVVELSNLHRQHLYGVDSLGYPKVEVAAKRLRCLNPNVEVEPLPLSVNESNAEDIVRGMDVVVDGLDSMAARYAINRACVKLGVPYVFGAAITTCGNLSTIVPGETACLECFYGNLDDSKLPKCGVVGVHPSLVNVIASLEVSEAIRILTGKRPRLANKLMHFDLDEMELNEIRLARVESCPVCGSNLLETPTQPREETVEEVCGRKGRRVFVVVPEGWLDVNLGGLRDYLKQRGFKPEIEAELGLTFSKENVEVTVLKSGILILKGAKEKKEALQLFKELKNNW